MKKAAIVGSGLIGRAWAIVFARAGWNVSAWDPSEEVRRGFLATARADADALAAHGLVDDAAAVAGRISVADTLADALAGVTIVQENGPEKLDVKQRLFVELDRLAPAEAIIASSTSAITPSQFTEKLPGRARCLVGHPVNPPHLIPIVELCGAPWTAPETLDRAHAIYAEIGQSPIRVHGEPDGFILNRLQGALLAEAFRLVAEGAVSAEDLDLTLTDGLARRWSFIGPLATIELNAPGGIADYCARYTGFYRRLAADAPGVEVFEQASVDKLVDSWPHEATPDRLAKRTEWRNGRLAAFAAFLNTQNDE